MYNAGGIVFVGEIRTILLFCYIATLLLDCVNAVLK